MREGGFRRYYKPVCAGMIGLAAAMIVVAVFAGVIGIDPRPGFGATRLRILLAGVGMLGVGALVLMFGRKIADALDAADLSQMLFGPFSPGGDWPKRREIGLAALLASAVLAVDVYLSGRLGLLSYPSFYDGAAYLFVSKNLFYRLLHISAHPLVPFLGDLINNQAPLWHGVMILHYVLFGEGEWQAATVRFWPVFLLILAVVWAVRQRSSFRTACMAAAATALLPTVSVGIRSLVGEYFSRRTNFGNGWYFADLRPDFFAACLLAWAVLVLVQNAREPNRLTGLVSGVFAALAVLAKPSAFPVILTCWGIALLYAVVPHRNRVRAVFGLCFWASVAFVVLVLPWVVCGGLQSIAAYLKFGLTKSRVLYSNPNATFFTETAYYWALYSKHMGRFEGWLVLAAGTLSFLWSLRPGGKGDGRLWGFVLVAAVSYAAASATPNKNFFVGLFYYIPLWIFSWAAMAPYLEKAKSRAPLLYKLAALGAASYAAGFVLAAVMAFKGFPAIEFVPGHENKRVTRQIAGDLKEILGKGETFMPVTVYGYPNTLSYYMMDAEGNYPGVWVPTDPTVPTADLVAQAVTNRAILVFSEDIDEVSGYFNVNPVWKPFWRALYAHVKDPRYGCKKVKTYRFSDSTKPMGTYPLGGGIRRGLSVDLYVRPD